MEDLQSGNGAPKPGKIHPGGRDEQSADRIGQPSIWAPFRKLMAITTGIAIAAVFAASAWLHASGAPARWELYAAVAGGVAGTLLLTGALMGLVFVSARSGHDDDVDRRSHDN